MTNNPNHRLKLFIDSLSISYDKLATETGIARRTWQRQVEEGASIKSDYLIILKDKFGADINWILTGESVSGGDTSNKAESVSSMTRLANEKKVLYDNFQAEAPKGSMAAKLKFKDYDNPMVVLSYAITDLKREWEEGETGKMPRDEKEEWLLEAVKIIKKIATKYEKDLEAKLELEDNDQ